jgi:hypothetical protein
MGRGDLPKPCRFDSRLYQLFTVLLLFRWPRVAARSIIVALDKINRNV